MIFREYLKQKFQDEEIIEFGPLNRPLFNKKENKKISYADIRSTEEIKKLYRDNDYLKKTGISVDIDSIVDIDYKIEDNYLKTFKNKKFDVAYLSHVIEHMPDIIKFFIEIKEILKEEGRLVIIYPDKRYCFDHFRNSVSFRDAYATYKYGIKENARIAFDFSYNVVHENDAAFFWQGTDLINVISKNNIEDAEKYYKDTISGNITNDDVHFWPFSDIDFLKFIYEMKRANLLEYDVEEFYPTQDNTQEFMIILKKTSDNDCTNILNLINKYNTQKKEYDYRKKIEEKNNEIENMRVCIENIRTEQQSYIKEIDEKNIQIQNLTQEIKQVIEEKNNKTEELKKKIQEQEIKNCELKEAINNYEKSKSWKITKPIRKISNILNKIRRKEDSNV